MTVSVSRCSGPLRGNPRASAARAAGFASVTQAAAPLQQGAHWGSIAAPMPSSLAATLLLGSALALALAFHRNRAAQVFATLLFVALALGQPDLRLQYGAM